MSARYSMEKYMRPVLIERAFPLAVRIRPLVRAFLALPRRLRLRRELLLRTLAWTYRTLNERGTAHLPWSVFAADVEIEQTAAFIDTKGTFRGHDGIKGLLDELADAFGDVRFEPQAAVELSSDRILILLRFAASGRGSGIDLGRTVGHLVTMGRESVTQIDVYWEESEALQAAGLSE